MINTIVVELYSLQLKINELELEMASLGPNESGPHKFKQLLEIYEMYDLQKEDVLTLLGEDELEKQLLHLATNMGMA